MGLEILALKNIISHEMDMIDKLGIEKGSKNTLETGRQLREELIEPVKRSFEIEDTYGSILSSEQSSMMLWVVLEDKESNYRIVFDEHKKLFGLGIIGTDGVERYIGVNGNLLYTYNAM